jgi:transcriptional regulator with XRE-family HTH domain
MDQDANQDENQELQEPTLPCTTLKELRIAAGLRQQDVAQRTGWSRSKVARVEGPLMNRFLQNLAACQEATGVTIAVLVLANGQEYLLVES